MTAPDDLRKRLEAELRSIDLALLDAKIVFGEIGACSARNANATVALATLREVLAHPERLMGEPMAWKVITWNSATTKTFPTEQEAQDYITMNADEDDWHIEPLYAPPEVKP